MHAPKQSDEYFVNLKLYVLQVVHISEVSIVVFSVLPASP